MPRSVEKDGKNFACSAQYRYTCIHIIVSDESNFLWLDDIIAAIISSRKSIGLS